MDVGALCHEALDGVKAEGEITLNEELTDVKRIDPEKLKGWSFGTGLAVTDWLEKRKPNDK